MARTRHYDTKSLYFSARITEAMHGIFDYPLTVVEAPMGYGKTTAVREYLKDCDATVLWQTLADDSASGFWRGFCRLLKDIDAGCADRLDELGVPNNSIFLDTALELVADLVFAERTVIVFDDYHLLAAKSVERFIELLVKTAPDNLHIVIVSREAFGENTPELSLKGFCSHIDKSSFEFTQDEITAYYRLCGIRLQPGEAAELYAYTEGWISALYLCLLSFVRDGRVERQVSLPELIEKAVYRQCPPAVKEFLLNICVFDSFTLAQAQAIWPQTDAEEIVSYLMANNAFIKYDQYNKTYQMHNIFTGYLRELLARQGAEKRQAVLLAAGGWYLTSGDYIHAMDAFFAAGDFDKLLTAFELDNGRNINIEDKDKVIGYFSACPEAIKRQHPTACLTYARKMFSFNERAIYAAQCVQAGEYIAAVKDEKARNQLLGEYELIKSFSKYNDIRGMAEHQARAYELLDGPSKLFDDKNFWTYGSPSVLYMFYRKSGLLEQAVKELLAFMPRYRLITSGHGAGAEYVMLAEWHFHRGDFENAGIIVHKAMQAAQANRQIAIVLCALFLQLRLAFVTGDLEAARQALRQMRAEVEEYGQYQVVHTVDMCEGFIDAYLGREGKIPAWIAAGNLQESRLHFPSHAFFNIIYGKTLLISGQYLKLLGLAGYFHNLAGVFPNLVGQVYTYIYTAAAQHKLWHSREAQAALRQAAAIAAPDGVIMPFVENGEHIGDILADLARDDRYASFANRVNEAYAAFAPKLAAMREAAEAGDGAARLTARELEIAQLAAEGVTNREIGARLYISENTVKMALKSVFEKLGINSRALLKDSLSS